VQSECRTNDDALCPSDTAAVTREIHDCLTIISCGVDMLESPRTKQDSAAIVKEVKRAAARLAELIGRVSLDSRPARLVP